MAKPIFTIISFLLVLGLQAQNHYSYSSDRKFSDPTDLLGFDFKPSIKEIPGGDKEDINPGEYSFGITVNNLYVKGGEIEGVYNINNINTTEYGFKLLLINARDARLQGHLKVILNPNNQVDALVFRRSGNEKEMIFFLPLLTEELEEKESNFFTDLNETVVEEPDSIWGTQIFPFLKIHNNKGIQQRLQQNDSTIISFEMRETIIEKEVKKKNTEDEDEEEEENEETSEIEADSVLVSQDSLGEEVEKKIKIIRDYYIVVNQILTYTDGTSETNVDEYQVKKVKERQDELAELNEEKYQIEFSTTDGKSLYLYLTGRRDISSFEIEDILFLMRGH